MTGDRPATAVMMGQTGLPSGLEIKVFAVEHTFLALSQVSATIPAEGVLPLSKLGALLLDVHAKHRSACAALHSALENATPEHRDSVRYVLSELLTAEVADAILADPDTIAE